VPPPRRFSEPATPRDDAAPLSALVVNAWHALPLVGLMVLATGAMLAGYLIHRPAVNQAAQSLSVCVVNVGNGEAAWLRTPSGRSW
jgi:hypothetical protein